MVGSDQFVTDEPVRETKPRADVKTVRAKTLTNGAFDSETYEFKDQFTPGNPDDPFSCKTTHEMFECLSKKKDVLIEGSYLTVGPGGEKRQKPIKSKRSFLEAFKKNELKFREGGDSFGMDGGFGANSGDVGNDFMPVLGGPFHKQLYTYDFLKMQAAAFWAVNHDPIARRIIDTVVFFTLGKGFRINFTNPIHAAYWEAFEDVNDFYNQMSFYARELATYGESMWWWLPNQETEVAINRGSGQAPAKGIIPRIRVLDPSNIWDIITYPEDIQRPLAYQWVAPTQYQTYTKVDGKDGTVQSLKFIFKQIPAEQIIHSRINCMSNEKRGRSDLFSVLGYLKRLRDSVTYSIIALQKNAAWGIDTEIQGNQSDIDGYVTDQAALGSVAPAGSEFVHTDKIKRQYLANSGTGKGGDSPAFDWCLSMIAAGSGIPVQYFGTHLQGSSTRASAVVGIEPVARLFEMRQRVYENVLGKIIRQFFKTQGIYDCDFNISWPEIITQDRAQKLKDLATAQTMKWFSPKRAANMAAKEFSQDDFTFDNEQKDIKTEQDAEPAMGPGTSSTTGGGTIKPDQPLTKPGLNLGQKSAAQKTKPSAVTGTEKTDIKRANGA